MLTVNPSELEVAANVRKDAQLTKQFVASVKQHGVLVPIIVTPGLAGYAVIDGQRRALAAVEAGLREVPVVVVDQPAEEKDRIVTQLVVNDQRAGVGQADTIAAVRELALFGMSATAIAKNLGEKKPVVDAALKVAASEAASAAVREREMSLDDALVFVEFEDYPEALAELQEYSAQGYSLDHVAQQWRDRRDEAACAAGIEAMEGVELIEVPGWDQADPLPISSLFADAEHTAALTVGEAEAYRGRGLCGYPGTAWENGERVWSVRYAIRGWKDLGLFTYAHIEERGKAAKPATPEEAEAAKQERRVARETTKAWKAATAVRLAWMQKVLARRVMPKGWDLLVAQHCIADSGYSAGEWDIILALLGLDSPEGGFTSRRQVVGEFLAGNPQRAQAVALACALASIEGGYDFDRKGWQHGEKTKAHLTRIRDWGYELSEVEAGVVG